MPVVDPPSREWPHDVPALEAEQHRLAALRPPPWEVPDATWRAGGCFLAFARGEQGPGHAGDHGWAGAALLALPGLELVDDAVVTCIVGARYEPGRLALREGPALASAVDALQARPDVLLVDATGRDHPRHAGLAVELGVVLDLPTVGVTHRPLLARGGAPGPRAGDSSPLELDGEVVGAWVRTHEEVQPLAVHAGWRVDVSTAVRVVLACTGAARTPEPLRRAREVARLTRARAERRSPDWYWYAPRDSNPEPSD